MNYYYKIRNELYMELITTLFIIYFFYFEETFAFKVQLNIIL